MEERTWLDHEELQAAWLQFGVAQTELKDPGEVRVFVTLTFGGSRPPGPQRGRKALEAWMAQDDILSGIATEERGSENDRLHYHAVVVIEAFAGEDSIGRIQDAWTHGYSMMDLMRELGALAYVLKYATKNMEDANFFYVKERESMAFQPTLLDFDILAMIEENLHG